MGSSDTLIYILSVYFSATALTPDSGVRHTRHATAAAILVMIAVVFLSCGVSRLFFSSSIA
jgi:spore maturation protein SpmB